MKKEKDITKKNTKKTGKTKKTNKKSSSNSKKDIIDLDNEIIIGLTPKKGNDSEKKDKKSNKKGSKGKDKNKKNKSKNTKKTVSKTSTKSKTKQRVKNRKAKAKKEKTKKSLVVKIVVLVLLIILCIVLFLLSSVFNIREIKVNNNNKISTEEIINLSQLKINENMFKTSNNTIRNRLKQNPYIEDVQINKKLNGVIELSIIEREATFCIKYIDKYAYLNNQGYVLELSPEPILVPELIGITTPEENIKPGNRLDNLDLEKLDTVIKIVASAKSLEIDSLITGIDISNDKDYLIYLAGEFKTVHFGDISDKNDKMAWIKEIVEQKKGEEGEIFVNDLSKRVYFRKKI